MSGSLFGGRLVKCRNCEGLISSAAEECPLCGEDLTIFKPLGSQMVTCRNCNREISGDATICPFCSENLHSFKPLGRQMVDCRNCGAEISSDATICPHCGENLDTFKPLGSQMADCRNCRVEISSDATICPHCGEDQDTFKPFGSQMVACNTCNASISSDAGFCPKCAAPQRGFFNSGRPISKPAYEPGPRIDEDSRQNDESTDGTGLLIKWAVYIALFIAAVWLAFAIVLPLVILNAALVLLICGFIWKEQAKIFFAIAIAGVIYLMLDIDFRGLSSSLMARAVLFQTLITICVYLNITAAMIAAYLLFRRAPASNGNEFSKRNLIVLAAAGVAGAGLVLVNLLLLGGNRYVVSSTAPIYSAPAPVQSAPVATAPQSLPMVSGATQDSTKLADSTRTAAEAAPATTNQQLDTNQVKSDLIGKIGNVQYSDQITSVSQIQSIEISDRVNTPSGLSFHALLTFNPARHAQVEMTYLFTNGVLSFSTARLMELTKLITVPADGWTRILAPAGFVMHFKDDSRMYWKAYDGGQVYESGADVGPVTFPTSNVYMVSSRGDGPLAFDVVFTPAN